MFGKITPWKIISGLVRFLFLALVAGVIGIFIWRSISYSNDPDEMRVLVANEALTEAYGTYGDELELYTQEQGTYTRAERNNGYFFIRQAVFIPQAEQVQILFRYNNSTIKALVEDYGLPETPDREEILYDLSIVIKRDLTPDIVEDYNEEGCYTLERYYPSTQLSGARDVYNYRKLVFDGIVIDETVIGVFVDIYYIGDIAYEEDAYGTLCIWDFESPDLPVKLTRDDIKAITAP